MSEAENKASVQHTPAEWVSSNQDHYINADKAKYNSEKVICNDLRLEEISSFSPVIQKRMTKRNTVSF